VYQTAVERAFVEGALDPFPYRLAEKLGMTVETMFASMSMREYQHWRAFHVWREAERELAVKTAEAKQRTVRRGR